MQNKRKSLEFTVYLVFKFITFVYAQPELVVSGSAATDFDFPNTQEGIVVIIIFRKKDVQFFSCFRLESDFQHALLHKD